VSTLESGQRVGRYRIVRFLGAGAMGEVYLAEDPHIERRLAIKTVRLAGGRPQDVEDRKKRLLREARAAGRLLHPNVVALFDAGEEDGLLFLAFEFVEGSDLASRLEAGPPPSLREVLRIVRQVADALDCAHRQGIVHRDIKPSNILLDAAGHVKVADFGIAKMAGQNTELTIAGSVMGSPQYLSPEQIRGDELDGRSDIFSLGVVLYELLSGRRPFDGETITTLVYQILHKEPAIAELRAVPLRLEQLLHSMLAKDRDQRLATAALVAEELAAIERELPEAVLAAPAAPAEDMLDVTRVLPSRALVPGAAGPGTAGGAAPGTAGSEPGGAAPSGAIIASGGLAAVAAGAGTVPGAPGLHATAGAGAPGNPGGAPSAPILHPGAATAGPGAVPGSAAAAPSRQEAPAGVRQGGRGKTWLVLAAVLIVLLLMLGLGVLWAWQRYLQPMLAARLQSGSSASTATAAAPGGSVGPTVGTAAAPGGLASGGAPPADTAGGGAAVPSAAGATAPPAAEPPGRQTGQAGAGEASDGRLSRRDGHLPARALISPPGHEAAAPSAPGQARHGTGAAGTTGAGAGAASAEANRGGAAGTAANGANRGLAGATATAGGSRGGAADRAARSDGARAATPGAATSALNAPPGSSPSDATPATAAGRAQRRAAGDLPAGSRATSESAAAVAVPPPGALVASPPASAGAAALAADRVLHSGLELAFRINPPDAILLLDGGVIGRADEWSGSRGARSYTLPGTGAHLIKIKKSGMKDYRINVEATATRGVTYVDVAMQPLPAAQVDTADLQTVQVREAVAFHLRPEVGATLIVDGSPAGPAQRFAGRFGHSEEWLPLNPGSHRISISAPGYQRRDVAVEVSSGAERARQRIEVTLVPQAGAGKDAGNR
jgi:hypothetical protein